MYSVYQGGDFFTLNHLIHIIILLSWIQAGRLALQSEVDRSTAIPLTTIPVSSVWWVVFWKISSFYYNLSI